MKLGLLLTILIAVARAAVAAGGQEYSADVGSVAVGYEEGRRLAEHGVSTMTELWNKVSNDESSSSNIGTDIMANGDTTTLSVGEYKCSDGSSCADVWVMLATYHVTGTIRCLNDDATCVLDGESSRRGLRVTDSVKLTIRAIRFYRGRDWRGGDGGGIYVSYSAKVDINLCVFDSCEATDSNYGGGGIFVSSMDSVVNIYATTFTRNKAGNGGGDDIYKKSGSVTIHDTCPSPYSANTPTQGKYERMASITAQYYKLSQRS